MICMNSWCVDLHERARIKLCLLFVSTKTEKHHASQSCVAKNLDFGSFVNRFQPVATQLFRFSIPLLLWLIMSIASTSACWLAEIHCEMGLQNLTDRCRYLLERVAFKQFILCKSSIAKQNLASVSFMCEMRSAAGRTKNGAAITIYSGAISISILISVMVETWIIKKNRHTRILWNILWLPNH